MAAVATGLDALRNIRTKENAHIKNRKEAIGLITRSFNALKVDEGNARSLAVLLQTTIHALSEDESETWGFFRRLLWRPIYLLLDRIFHWKEREVRTFIRQTQCVAMQVGRLANANIEDGTKYHLLSPQNGSMESARLDLPEFFEPADYVVSEKKTVSFDGNISRDSFDWLDRMSLEDLSGDFLLPLKSFERFLALFSNDIRRVQFIEPAGFGELFKGNNEELNDDFIRGRAIKAICILAMGSELFLRTGKIGDFSANGEIPAEIQEFVLNLKAFVGNGLDIEREEDRNLTAILNGGGMRLCNLVNHQITRDGVPRKINGRPTLLSAEDQRKVEQLFQCGPDEFQNQAVNLFPGRPVMQYAASLGQLASFLGGSGERFPFETESHPLLESAVVQLLEKKNRAEELAAAEGNPPMDRWSDPQFGREFNGLCFSLIGQIERLQNENLRANAAVSRADIAASRQSQTFYSKLLLELLTVNNEKAATILESDTIDALVGMVNRRQEILNAGSLSPYGGQKNAKSKILNMNFYGISSFLTMHQEMIQGRKVEDNVRDHEEFAAALVDPKLSLVNCLAGDSEDSINDAFNESSNCNLRKFYPRKTIDFLLGIDPRSRWGGCAKVDLLQESIKQQLKAEFDEAVDLEIDWLNGIVKDNEGGFFLAKHDRKASILSKLSNYDQRQSKAVPDTILIDDGLVTIDSTTLRARHREYGNFVELNARTGKGFGGVGQFLGQLVAFKKGEKVFLFMEKDLSKPLLVIEKGELKFFVDGGEGLEKAHLLAGEETEGQFGGAGLAKLRNDGTIERFVSFRTSFLKDGNSKNAQESIYVYDLEDSKAAGARAGHYRLSIDGIATNRYLAEPIEQTLFRSDGPLPKDLQLNVPWLWSKKDGYLHSLDGNFVYDPEGEVIVDIKKKALGQFCDIFMAGLDHWATGRDGNITEAHPDDIVDGSKGSPGREILDAPSPEASEVRSDGRPEKVASQTEAMMSPKFIRMLSQIIDRTCEDPQSELATLIYQRLLYKLLYSKLSPFEDLLDQSSREDFELRNELAILYFKMITACDRVQRQNPQCGAAKNNIRRRYNRGQYGKHCYDYDRLFRLLYETGRHNFALDRQSPVRFGELKQFYEIFHQYRFMPLILEREYRRLKGKEREIGRLGDAANRAFVDADRKKPVSYYMGHLDRQTFESTPGELEMDSYYSPSSHGGIHRGQLVNEKGEITNFDSYGSEVIEQVAGADAFIAWNNQLQNYRTLVKQAAAADIHGEDPVTIAMETVHDRWRLRQRVSEYLSRSGDLTKIWQSPDENGEIHFLETSLEIFGANLEKELGWNRSQYGPLLDGPAIARIRGAVTARESEAAAAVRDDREAMKAEIKKLLEQVPFGEKERRQIFSANLDDLFDKNGALREQELESILKKIENSRTKIDENVQRIGDYCNREKDHFCDLFQKNITDQMAQLLAIGAAQMPRFEDLLRIWSNSLSDGKFSADRFRQLWQGYCPAPIDNRAMANLNRCVQKYLFLQTELNAALAMKAKLNAFARQLENVRSNFQGFVESSKAYGNISKKHEIGDLKKCREQLDDLEVKIENNQAHILELKKGIETLKKKEESISPARDTFISVARFLNLPFGKQQNKNDCDARVENYKNSIDESNNTVSSYEEKRSELQKKYNEVFLARQDADAKQRALENSKIELRQGWNDFAEQTQAERAYNPLEEPFLLWFEYKTGMRIRASQIDVLKKLKDQMKVSAKNLGIIFQLIMGGGKTSVILSQLAKLFAEEGKVAIFANHHSQHESMLGNLIKFQRERYGQDVIEIDYSFAQLMHRETLAAILEKFKRAKNEAACVAMKSSFLRSILLFQMKQIKAVQMEMAAPRWTGWRDFFRGIKSEDEIKLRLANEIMDFIHENCVQILDEVDLNLDPSYSVNVPAGEKAPFFKDNGPSQPKDFKLEIVEDLFRLVRGDRELNKKFQASTAFAVEDFRSIAEKFEEKWRLGDEDKETMLSFLLQPVRPGEGNADKIAQDWAAFKAKYTDGEGTLPQKVAFLRGMFETMNYGATHQNNQNYGFRLDANTLKVVPYRGSNTPSTGEFAHPLELSFFTYSSYLKDEVFVHDRRHPLYRKIAKIVENVFAGNGRESEARWLSTAWPEIYNRTVLENNGAAGEFTLPQLFEDARKAYNQNIQEGIREHIVDRVVQYVNHLRVNADDCENNWGKFFSFVQLASAGSFNLYPEIIEGTCYAQADMTDLAIGDTGTPWNRRLLGEKFQNDDRNYLDGTTEPLICNKIVADLEGGVSQIHQEQAPTLDSLIQKISRGTRAIIDVAGFLKDYDNALVAQQIAAQKKDCGFRGVVYYDSYRAAYYLLKTDSKEPPLRLQNTSPAEIGQVSGLNSNEVFVYYDEIRTTGSDFKLDPGADAILTCDLDRTTKRSLFQGALRLRQFLSGQKINFVVKGDLAEEESEVDKFWKVYDRCGENQNRGLSPDKVYRAYVSQLANRARIIAERKLMSYLKSPFYYSLVRHHNFCFIPSKWYNDFQQCYASYEKLAFKEAAFDPVAWYQPSTQKSAIECLKQKQKYFAHLLPEELRAEFNSAAKTLLEEAGNQLKTSRIAATATVGGRAGAEMGQEVEQEQEEEQEQQQTSQFSGSHGGREPAKEPLFNMANPAAGASTSDVDLALRWGMVFSKDIVGKLVTMGNGTTVIKMVRQMQEVATAGAAAKDPWATLENLAVKRPPNSDEPWTYKEIIAEPANFAQALLTRLTTKFHLTGTDTNGNLLDLIKNKEIKNILARLVRLLSCFVVGGVSEGQLFILASKAIVGKGTATVQRRVGQAMNKFTSWFGGKKKSAESNPSDAQPVAAPAQAGEGDDDMINGILVLIDQVLGGLRFKRKIGDIGSETTVSIAELGRWLENDFRELAASLGFSRPEGLWIEKAAIPLKDVQFVVPEPVSAEEVENEIPSPTDDDEEPMTVSTPRGSQSKPAKNMTMVKSMMVIIKGSKNEVGPDDTFKTGTFVKNGKTYRVFIKNGSQYAFMEDKNPQDYREGNGKKPVIYPEGLQFRSLSKNRAFSTVLTMADSMKATAADPTQPADETQQRDGMQAADRIPPADGAPEAKAKPAGSKGNGKDQVQFFYGFDPASNEKPIVNGDEFDMLSLALKVALEMIPGLQGARGQCQFANVFLETTKSYPAYCYQLARRIGQFEEELDDLLFLLDNNRGVKSPQDLVALKNGTFPEKALPQGQEKTLTYRERLDLLRTTGKMPPGTIGKKSKILYDFITQFVSSYFPLIRGSAAAALLKAGDTVDHVMGKERIKNLNQNITDTTADDGWKNVNLFSDDLEVSAGMQEVFRGGADPYYLMQKYCAHAVIYVNSDQKMKILLVSAAEEERIRVAIENGTMKYAWLVDESGTVLTITPLQAERKQWTAEHSKTTAEELANWKKEHPKAAASEAPNSQDLLDYLSPQLKTDYGIEDELKYEAMMRDKIGETQFNLRLYNGNLVECKQMNGEWQKIARNPRKLMLADAICGHKHA